MLTARTLSKQSIPLQSLPFRTASKFSDWSITKLEDINQLTRNVLRKHVLHENSDVDRIYVSIPNGWRGLLNITNFYKSQIITYSKHLQRSTEKLMMLKSIWQAQRGAKFITHINASTSAWPKHYAWVHKTATKDQHQNETPPKKRKYTFNISLPQTSHTSTKNQTSHGWSLDHLKDQLRVPYVQCKGTLFLQSI